MNTLKQEFEKAVTLDRVILIIMIPLLLYNFPIIYDSSFSDKPYKYVDQYSKPCDMRSAYSLNSETGEKHYMGFMIGGCKI